jgi:ferredoxin
MMKSVVEGLGAAGVEPGRIHHEAFGPASVKGAAPPAATAPAPAGELAVVFARSGKRVAWNGAATILEMAEAAGIAMDSGCRAGNCGSCTTAVRRGEVGYAGKPGADIAPGSCLACVGLPRSEVEVDA